MDNAVRYLRVSNKKQDEHNQVRAIDELIKKNGWKCVNTYKDHGKSAYRSNVRRKGFERMLKDAELKKFQHIVVFSLSRFSRQLPTDVIALIKHLRSSCGVEVHACFGDEWRSAVQAISKMEELGIIGKATAVYIETIIRGTQVEMARRESEEISRRILESKKFQRAKKRKKNKKIGRPRIPDDVVTLVEALLEYNVPYKGIIEQVSYRNAEGAIRIPSESAVSIIKKRHINRKMQQNPTA